MKDTAPAIARQQAGDLGTGTTMLTTRQAGAILGVGRHRIVDLIGKGKLPAVAAGDRWALRREDVEAFAAIPRPVGRAVGSRVRCKLRDLAGQQKLFEDGPATGEK